MNQDNVVRADLIWWSRTTVLGQKPVSVRLAHITDRTHEAARAVRDVDPEDDALGLWRAYPSLLLQASAERSLVGAGEDKAKLLDSGTVRAMAGSLCPGKAARSRPLQDAKDPW